jgi:6-phosphogluconolactonase
MHSILRRWRSFLVLGAGLVAVVGVSGPAAAGDSQGLKPGAVFTQSNTVPNYVRIFRRSADGTRTAAGQLATGGNGRIPNPPGGVPILDTAGSVELSSDGDNKQCLFVTNAGSNTVSSFSVGNDGIALADQKATNGSRPVSLTSNKRVLYVLNSDVASASIQGYSVSKTCALTPIPGSWWPTSNPASQPAQIAFNERGTVLAVSERFGPSEGDIDIFPVNKDGVAGMPIVSQTTGPAPYGLAWTKRDQLTVSDSNEGADPAGSTVSSYQLVGNTLVPINTLPSPGFSCWNVITDNGKFLYISQPAGHFFAPAGFSSVNIYTIGHDGKLGVAGLGVNTTPNNALDEALSHDSQYLYVLANELIPPGPTSSIHQYSVDQATGQLTFLGVITMPGNSTSGLAAW